MKNYETSIIERRKSKRWNLKVPLRVFEADTKSFVGHVLDVSLHGLRVASENPFVTEQEMLFDLEIPDGNGQWRMTSVTVLSVYTVADAIDHIYYNGLKFVHIEPESLLSLQQLIDEISSFS